MKSQALPFLDCKLEHLSLDRHERSCPHYVYDYGKPHTELALLSLPDRTCARFALCDACLVSVMHELVVRTKPT